jgi:hypothetical protein
MDTLDFETSLRNLVSSRGHSLAEDIRAIDAKLSEGNVSASLWILRGDLIQLCDDCEEDLPLEEALHSYEAAIRCEPSNPEGYEELAYYLDKIEDKPREAEPYFRKAIALGAGKSAQDGLAQVLEQLNEPE